MKGFEKILFNFNQVTTQMDITVTKLSMMLDSREAVDLDSLRSRMDTIKNNLENAFAVSRQILCLPLYSSLDISIMKEICNLILDQ